MKIKFLWIGRSKDANFCDLIDLYSKRLRHYCTHEIHECKETKGRLESDDLKRREAEVLLRQVDPQDHLVLLDERGKQYTSVELSDFFQAQMNQARPRLVFAIGGAFGVDASVTKRADFVWSLSKLTLTHDMARVFLMEQTYRAFTILRGERYHNE